MKDSDYNLLINYTKAIIREKRRVGQIEASDIVNDIFIEQGFIDIDSFKFNIIKSLKKEIRAHTNLSEVSIKEKTKVCSKCHETLSASHFYKYERGTIIIIDSKCKSCHCEYGKQYRKRTKGKFSDRDSKRGKEYRNRDYVKAVTSTKRYRDKINEYQRERYKKDILRRREIGKKHTKESRARLKKNAAWVKAQKAKNRLRWIKADKNKLRETNKIASKKYYQKNKLSISEKIKEKRKNPLWVAARNKYRKKWREGKIGNKK